MYDTDTLKRALVAGLIAPKDYILNAVGLADKDRELLQLIKETDVEFLKTAFEYDEEYEYDFDQLPPKDSYYHWSRGLLVV